MTVKTVKLLGREVKFVPRSTLRSRSVRAHFNHRAIVANRAAGITPVPSTAFNWSKNHTVNFPIDGNDQEGDCFYACACHLSNLWTANVGTEDTFNLQAIIQSYLALSGGDNGLSPEMIFPFWQTKGLAGTNHKILDYAPISPTDMAAMRAGLFYFGGNPFTLGIPDKWLGNDDANINPGVLWDAGPGVAADDNNGHAVLLSGVSDATTNVFDVETWALNPPIRITPAGIGACDPEAFVAFSLDWFNAQGIAPNKMSYDQLASVWTQATGRTLPASPFAPSPTPGPTPTPAPGPVVPAPLIDQVNKLFAQVESLLAHYPRLLNMVKIVQNEVDAVLSVAGNRQRTASLSSVQLQSLADALLDAVKALFPAGSQVSTLITQLKQAIDSLMVATYAPHAIAVAVK